MAGTGGGQRSLFGFRFPDPTELENASIVPVDGRAVRRQIKGRAVLFLLSAFLPVAVSIATGVALAKIGAGLSDAQYFTLLLLLVTTMFVLVLQWRDTAIRLWPIHAMDYYASTVLNRLRVVETATDADLAYLRVVMPDFEKILTRGLLARRLAGTSLARERFAAYHGMLAQNLGDCETRLLRDPGPESTRAMKRFAASLLVGGWARLPASDDAWTVDSVDLPTGTSLVRRAGDSLLNKSVEKVAEGAVAALIVLGGGIAWR
ncbi:hypothetical protein [Pedococcus bigeumensis]|uniref:hypothetical protein n=1 Tax=Pedococcus bigeumensis TaxID=433644 RepID=UPI002FEAAA97